MGLTEKDIGRLGAGAQKQIRAQMAAQITKRLCDPKKFYEQLKQPQVRVLGAAEIIGAPESGLEQEYFNSSIAPKALAGFVARVEMHCTFLLLDADEYCGIKLHKAEYTPDFVVTYVDGSVEVVEVKHRKIRQLQGSYVYRRRLFIDKFARPSGWKFIEVIGG